MPQLTPEQLAQRAGDARARLSACDLCSWNCRVDRTAGKAGVCRLGGEAFFFNETLHYGIELELLPAHAIYMTGCSMRCAYCNVMDWVERPIGGHAWNAGALAERVRGRRREGAKTLLIVGGEPTVNLAPILEMLAQVREPVTLVWDSNLLLSPAARTLLDGVVDIYIADFKFGNDTCARAIGGVNDYLATLGENLRFAQATSRLIVRHLLMPGHLDCCFRPMLAWIQANLQRPRLSLRGEYLPPRAAADARLGNFLAAEEWETALAEARGAGVELVA